MGKSISLIFLNLVFSLLPCPISDGAHAKLDEATKKALIARAASFASSGVPHPGLNPVRVPYFIIN